MEAQQSQEVGLDKLKPSKMNRLQRSLVSGRVATVAKDSTVRISNFLTHILRIFKTHLEENPEANNHWKVSVLILIYNHKC
jgi:midasin